MNNRSIYGIVYKCTNKINGKIYIGKTTRDFKKYIQSHLKSALIYKDERVLHKIFYNAINKYGADNFNWEIIDTIYVCDDCIKLLNSREKYWISYYDSYKNRDKGYNMTEGGDGGDTLSTHPNKDEIYKKSGNSLKEKHLNETEEEREKRLSCYIRVSLSQKGISKGKGRKSSKKGKTIEEIRGSTEKGVETRNKMSNSTKGSKNPFYGKMHSFETMEIIKQKNHEYQEKIFKEKFDKYSEDILKLYNKKISLKNIAKELHISGNLVHRVVKYLKLPIGTKNRGLKKNKNYE